MYNAIIDKYYPEDDDLRRLLLRHSRQVADRCLLIADRKKGVLSLDLQFLEEGAMLHDIGIRWCDAPGIHCHGSEPYLEHGLIGGRLLREEGLPRHARVCETHTGTGYYFPPETLEEKLICYADKFYSKAHPDRILTIEQTAQSVARWSEADRQRFLEWATLFEDYICD